MLTVLGLLIVLYGYDRTNQQTLTEVKMKEQQTERKVDAVSSKLRSNDKAHLLILQMMVSQYNEEMKILKPGFTPQPNQALEYMKAQVQEDFELQYPSRGVKQTQ